MTIRTAVRSDWPLIWPFFQATVLAGETYAFPMDLTIETGRGWWMATPPNETVVLEEAGPGDALKILGSAKMGPNRPGHGDHIGTASFMVAPETRGRGVGRALGEYVVQWHRERGFHGIQFNAVVETNTAAVKLWQNLGFRIVGTVPDAFRSPAHGLVGLHVMYLDLG
jgi:GNAT superfamily N-acetyltransferase